MPRNTQLPTKQGRLVLTLLKEMYEENSSFLCVEDLATLMEVPHKTMAGIIGRLNRQGYITSKIENVYSKEEGRVRTITRIILTDLGKNI